MILRRKVTRATGTAEREAGLEMVDEVREKGDELGLKRPPEILTADANFGATDFVTAIVEREIAPHHPPLADSEPEEIPTRQRRTFDLEQTRARKRKVQETKVRNPVRQLTKTRGYTVSRELRTWRVEHSLAEAETWHVFDRARPRGLECVQLQATLTAVVQNLKRLVAFLGRKQPGSAQTAALKPAHRRLEHILDSIGRICAHIGHDPTG